MSFLAALENNVRMLILNDRFSFFNPISVYLSIKQAYTLSGFVLIVNRNHLEKPHFNELSVSESLCTNSATHQALHKQA